MRGASHGTDARKEPPTPTFSPQERGEGEDRVVRCAMAPLNPERGVGQRGTANSTLAGATCGSAIAARCRLGSIVAVASPKRRR